MTSGRTSDTQPFTPIDPSSVVTVTASAARRASTTPNSRSSVAAPRIISTWQPRSRSAPLFWLAAALRERGCHVEMILGAATEDRLFGVVEARRAADAVTAVSYTHLDA